MQIAMLDDAFDPLPHGDLHYVPVLQTRKGELDALSRLPESAWSRIAPVLCWVGDKAPTMTITDDRVRNWSARVYAVTRSRPFYIDVVRQSPSTPVDDANKSPLITRLYDRARQRGCRFVPVYRERWQSPAAMAAVTAANDRDGRGAALRLDLAATLGVNTALADRAVSATTALDIDPAQMDLMLDLGHLDADSDPDCEGLAVLVGQLANHGWRHIVLLATTMPKALGKDVIAPGTVGMLPRHERDLYRALQLAGRNGVVYGDYGIQHPEPPLDKSGPGMRANIRYTVATETIVARGERPVIEVGSIEYTGLCAALAAHQAFAGADFSWGDEVIADCAQGHTPPGSQAMWRGAGASHHIMHVLRELTGDGRNGHDEDAHRT